MYRIEVSVTEAAAKAPRVVHESLDYPLSLAGAYMPRGETGFGINGSEATGTEELTISSFPQRGTSERARVTIPPTVPILFQVSEDVEGTAEKQEHFHVLSFMS